MTVLTLTEPSLIKEMEAIASEQQTKPEALLNRAVRQFVDQTRKPNRRVSKRVVREEYPAAPPEFLREMEAFERLKPELMKQYRGRVVAIHGEQVVAVGDDILAVHDAVMKEFGFVPCFVQLVVEELPTRRIPSIWKAQ